MAEATGSNSGGRENALSAVQFEQLMGLGPGVMLGLAAGEGRRKDLWVQPYPLGMISALRLVGRCRGYGDLHAPPQTCRWPTDRCTAA